MISVLCIILLLGHTVFGAAKGAGSLVRIVTSMLSTAIFVITLGPKSLSSASHRAVNYIELIPLLVITASITYFSVWFTLCLLSSRPKRVRHVYGAIFGVSIGFANIVTGVLMAGIVLPGEATALRESSIYHAAYAISQQVIPDEAWLDEIRPLSPIPPQRKTESELVLNCFFCKETVSDLK